MLYLESPPQITSLSTKFMHERGGVPQLDKYPCIQANPHVCDSSLPTVRRSIKCNVRTLDTHRTYIPDKKNIIKHEKNDETSTVRWRVWTYHPSISNVCLRVRLKHLTDISRMSAGSSLYHIGPRYRNRRLPAAVLTDGRRKSSSWRVVQTRASRFVWMEVEMDTGVLYTRILCSSASQGRRHRFWTGGGSLSRKGALGGRGPF